MFLILFGIIVFAVVIKSAIKIVPSGSVGIVFRTGKFKTALPSGLHFCAPFLDRLFTLNPGQSGIMMSDRLCEFEGIQAPVVSRDKMDAGDPVRIEKIENEKIFVVGERFAK
jgi:hypothetical protein